MAKKEKDPNYELRFREIQKAFNQLCFQFGEEQMKNFALLNFAILIASQPPPSELKPKELKEFASYIHTKARQLHKMFVGNPSRWSWEQEDGKETEDENAV